MVIAITGGICCGKTTVLNILKELNYEVLNVDDISHKVLEQDEVKEEIKQKISTTVFCYDKIDRKKLGAIVFSDKKKLKILNEIMHKKIITLMLKEIKKVEKNKLVFFEVPLLYELNLEKYFAAVILIYTNRQTQIERLMKRDLKNKEQAEAILSKQIDIEEKKKRSKYIIENMDISKIKGQIKDILERIKYENK